MSRLSFSQTKSKGKGGIRKKRDNQGSTTCCSSHHNLYLFVNMFGGWLASPSLRLRKRRKVTTARHHSSQCWCYCVLFFLCIVVVVCCSCCCCCFVFCVFVVVVLILESVNMCWIFPILFFSGVMKGTGMGPTRACGALHNREMSLADTTFMGELLQTFRQTDTCH